MSRINVAKGKNDKGGKGTTAPTPHPTVDIVPGKFTDLDWYSLVDHDDSDEFISDIIDQVCDDVMGIIYKNYLQRQLIPFTVDKAKSAIIHLVQWQFLAGDAGEVNAAQDVGWQEEEEPEPCVTDCWAQGSVPRKSVTPRPDSVLEQVLDEIPEIEELAVQLPTVSEEPTMEVQTPSEPPMGGIPHERTIIEDDNKLVIEGSAMPLSPQVPPSPEPTKTPSRKKFKPYGGKLKSAGVSRMTESLQDREIKLLEEEFISYEETQRGPAKTPDKDLLLMPVSMHSVIKLQAGRPPGNREVVFDEHGNVKSMSKINPSRLPSHRVKTRFKIVDPDVEAAKARLEAMRTGKYVKTSPQKQPPKRAVYSKEAATLNITKSPLPPPMIEAMEVAPGVVVKENDRVKRGPRIKHDDMELIETALKQGLRPVRFRNSGAVPPVLHTTVPVIKPFSLPAPIPPISQQ